VQCPASRGGLANAATHIYIHGDRYTNADCHADAYAHADCYADAYEHADGHADGHADADPDQYPHQDADGDAPATHGDANASSAHRYADGDRAPYANCHTHARGDLGRRALC
jgi:hypothetical protein